MHPRHPSAQEPLRRNALPITKNIVRAALSLGLAAMLTAGCGQTGSPLPPSLQLPETVTDLTAMRIGEKVELTWTMPRRTTDKLLLKGPQTVHICRHIDQGPCIAIADVSFAPEKSVTYEDTLPSDLAEGAPRLIAYSVEILSRHGRTAGASNRANTAGGLAPPPFTGLQGKIEADGVLLQWEPASLEGRSNSIRIQRSLVSNPKAETQSATKRNPPLGTSSKTPVQLQTLIVHLASGTDPGRLLDLDAAFDQSYSYKIARTETLDLGGKSIEVEGPTSAAVIVDTKDIFPPRPPTGLAAVAAPREGAIDLSWTPGTEKDLAGYAVYRRQSGGTPTRISDPSKPIDSPAFRDQTPVPAHEYTYFVTAIDFRGNESKPSTEATETLPSKPR
jgi:hypothetical protein